MNTNISLIKYPSAWVPIVMSLVALATVLSHIALFGTAHEVDEGTAAHIFQLLIAGQVLVVAFFAIRWLPRTPKQALLVLMLQVCAALVALAPVYIFKL